MIENRQWLALGKLGKPKGLKGELYFAPYNPASDTLAHVSKVRVLERDLNVDEFSSTSKRLVIHFQEIQTIEEATPLVGKELHVRRDAMPKLPKGQYYVEDLIGFRVVTISKDLGKLTAVLPTASNDIYVIQGEEEILLPIIPGVVQSIDPSTQTILVTPPEVIDAI